MLMIRRKKLVIKDSFFSNSELSIVIENSERSIVSQKLISKNNSPMLLETKPMNIPLKRD